MGQFLLTKVGMWPTRRVYVAKLLELSLCAVALTFALPMSVALFQQRGMVTNEEIEEEFRSFKGANGQEVKEFYFNKGL